MTALLTVREVAERFRCSPDHVYDQIRLGRLRVVNLGNGRRPCTRIPESELDDFIQRETRQAPKGS